MKPPRDRGGRALWLCLAALGLLYALGLAYLWRM